MMDVRFIDPREAVLIETGYGLDAIGSLKDVDLSRNGAETDADYRMRLVDRLWGSWAAALTPAVATGEFLDLLCGHEWRGPMGTETTAPTDEPAPNHVRDAVRANP